MASPPPSPTRAADADHAAAAVAAAATAAGNPVDATNSTDLRPHAPASTDESSGSGNLPLATAAPLPSSSAPPPPLPASLAGILDFKLSLDGSNFTRWRNYIHLMLARHHAEDHIRGDRAPAGGGGRGGQLGANRHQRGGRGRGRGRGRGDAPAGRGAGGQPWLGYFAPMGMPFPPPRAPWIPSNSSGILGPRPGPPTQAYPVLYSTHPPPAAPTPYAASPHAWDASAMFHAAPSYGSAFPAGADWIMDTGAASHVTGDPGSSHKGGAFEGQQ